MEKRDFIKKSIVGAAAIIVFPKFAKANRETADEFYRVLSDNQSLTYQHGFLDSQTLQEHHELYYKKASNELGKQFSSPKVPVRDILLNPNKYNKRTIENAALYFNHRLFFKSLMPRTYTENTAPFLHLVRSEFGGFSALKKEFIEATERLSGNGWVWLAFKNNHLKITVLNGNTSPLMLNSSSINSGFPLIALDVWEHAYKSKYGENKPMYAEKYLDQVNWSFASMRLQKAIEYYESPQAYR